MDTITTNPGNRFYSRKHFERVNRLNRNLWLARNFSARPGFKVCLIILMIVLAGIK